MLTNYERTSGGYRRYDDELASAARAMIHKHNVSENDVDKMLYIFI